MRILRWILIVMAAVVVLLGGAAAVLYKTFDPNDYRDTIVRYVAEKTGRTLRLEAPMSLTFFPWLGVELGKVALENPPGFGSEPFATVRELAVRVKVLPLLDGHLVVDTLEVEGLELGLHRLADGRVNWSDLGGQAPPAGAGDRQPSRAEAWLKGYAFQGVELRNGTVDWRDDQAGSRYRVDDLNLSTGSIAPGSSVPVEGRLRLEGLAEGGSADLGFTGTLGVGEDLLRVDIPDLRLELVARGPTAPSAVIRAEITAALAYDGASGELAVDDLKISAPGGLEMAGQVRATLGEPFHLAGELSLRPFSPREALAAWQVGAPDTRDPGVLATASGTFRLAATAERLALAPVNIRVDDTRVDGQAEIGFGSPPAVDFAFEIDSLDLDRYLPPDDSESAGQPKPSGRTSAKGTGLAGLAAMNARGTVSIGTLKVGGATMSDTRIAIASGNGAIRLDPVSGALYGGEYRGSLALKAAGSDVRWHATEQVKGIQVGPLLRDLAGEDRLTGTGQIEADLKGQGLSDADVRRSAQGSLRFDFRDGTLKGVNLAQVMRELEARVKGQRLERTGPLQTDFSTFSGTLEVGGGKARNDDLVMKSPFIRVTGKGGASLVDESIDYMLTAKAVASAAGQGGREFSDLEGIPVGVRVRGTFSEPSFTPDFEPALKALAKKQLEGQQDRLEEKARKEIDKALRRFF